MSRKRKNRNNTICVDRRRIVERCDGGKNGGGQEEERKNMLEELMKDGYKRVERNVQNRATWKESY